MANHDHGRATKSQLKCLADVTRFEKDRAPHVSCLIVEPHSQLTQ